MVDTITRETSAEGPFSSIAFHQWTIVSVATVQNTEREGVVPDIEPLFLSNTAMLLTELQAMTGQGDVSFPLEIPLVAIAEGAQMQRDAYEITENPFNGIYLNRFVENDSQDIDSDSASLNHTAESIAFRWMLQDKESGSSAENIVENLLPRTRSRHDMQASGPISLGQRTLGATTGERCSDCEAGVAPRVGAPGS